MIEPPVVAGTVGHTSVTAIVGAVPIGQVVEATFETALDVQASVPRAVTVLLTEHALAGAVKLEVKFADTPGARLATVNTVVGEDWLLTTVTLFNVTLPVFLTVPVRVTTPPAVAGVTGQFNVTAMVGAVVSWQTAVLILVTVFPLHWFWPVAVRMAVTEQTLPPGTV